MSRLKIKYNRESDNNLNLIRKISLILATIILICIFLPKQARFRYEFQKGKVWDHENLISPYNFAILKTQEELNEDKKISSKPFNLFMMSIPPSVESRLISLKRI
ncbi:hypothetical protein OKW96_15005 [Sphingobacterium sp. KU25419]|nr:hypothetical protein OKW96_15005 [Sphingobacterium sp. KU25419]